MTDLLNAFILELGRAEKEEARCADLVRQHLHTAPCGPVHAERLMATLLRYLPEMPPRTQVYLAKRLVDACRIMQRMCERGANFPALMKRWITFYEDALIRQPALRDPLLNLQWWPACFASWMLAGMPSEPSLGCAALIACHAANFGADGSLTLLGALLNHRESQEKMLRLVRSRTVTKAEIGNGEQLVQFVALRSNTLDALIGEYRAAKASCGITRWCEARERPRQTTVQPMATTQVPLTQPTGERGASRPRVRPAREQAAPPAEKRKVAKQPGPVIYRNQMPTHLRPARAHAIAILTVLHNRGFTGSNLLNETGLRQGVAAKMPGAFSERQYNDALQWCTQQKLVARGEGNRRNGVALILNQPHKRGQGIIARLRKLS